MPEKIDATCRNKWKWSWLEEKDENGDYLSTYVRKINVGGSIFCICCNKPLVHENTGEKDLLKHATKSAEHLCPVRRNIFHHTLTTSLEEDCK